MERSRIEVGICAALAAACLLLAAGCGRAPAERRDARDRYLRRAQAAKEAEDVEAAIRWCEKALRRRPDSAPVHRELALMYDHFKQDYVVALYHYRRYLDLRPESAERADVEDMYATCGQKLAAQFAAAPAPRPRPAATPPAAPPAAVAAREPAPPAAPAPRIHVVQAGENLATISARYYGTPSKWKVIFNANQGRLTDANNLRVGTRIDIPPG